MSRVVSKTGATGQDPEKVYTFLADLRHLDPLVPEETIENWQSCENQCHFQLKGFGSLGMEIVEKTPHKLVKLKNLQNPTLDFTLWIQIKQVSPGDTRIRITAEAGMNPALASMVTPYLQKGINAMVDKLTAYLDQQEGL